MKHIAFAFMVVWLTILGSAILVADIVDCTTKCHLTGNLHAVSGGVGAFLLLLAVAFAVPLRLKDALTALKPIAEEAKGLKP